MRPLTIGLLCLSLFGCPDEDPSATPDGQGATDDVQVVAEDTLAASDDVMVADPDDGPMGCTLGTKCDDGDPCTLDDQCDADAVCEGSPRDCNDDVPCTADSCSGGTCINQQADGVCVSQQNECIEDGASAPGKPCVVCEEGQLIVLADDQPCEDGDACTLGDRCQDGGCTAPTFQVCEGEDKEFECKTVLCDPSIGCTEQALEGSCEDGSKCTLSDYCAAGSCQPGLETLACNDNSACTVDACDSKLGCLYVADTDVCDDNDACTEDACSGETEAVCSSAPFEGPCEDGDACTEGEMCAAGVCSGGAAVDCDDDNVCTFEAGCESATGCIYHFVEGGCSDGVSCTINDDCVAGLCLGAKAFCSSCPSPETSSALKVVDFKFAADGFKGSALDVDGDPLTCAPAGKCSDGVDNSLAVLAPLLNPAVSQSLGEGTLKYVVDLSGVDLDGGLFPFAVYDAEFSEESVISMCAFQTETCSYTVTDFSFDPFCKPYFGLDNATIIGSKLTAGGPGTIMTIALALSSNTLIPITLVHARLEGDVTLNQAGDKVLALTGIVSGATPKQQLIQTVQALDPSTLPVDKALAIQILNDLVVNDIDLDGDGILDAASLGIRFDTIGATIVLQ